MWWEEKAARVGEVMVSSDQRLCVVVVVVPVPDDEVVVGGEIGDEDVRLARPVVSVPGTGTLWLVRGVV